MKNNIEEIDKLIKETLSEEEAKFYKGLEEQPIFDMIKGLFTGKNKWILYVMNFMTVFFFAIFIYCIIQISNTEETNELIRWGIYCFIALIAMSMLKMFAWMQMDKNAIIRELKRLEILVSSLSSRIKK
ncbi:DUF6768 family protein [Polaribacter glomeratus]|uniref:Uncharacterized protein n=1 Tax=Polaribacter glomeratus TaxID=102 RepID=A0A2S7WVY7_9FLAO|nr:DUF6768 family protein [Polaribacter glomeratus]PQJ81769.1 hypothetical protein BTO16_03930 [Polaribacter glomeratus]TXD66307.1 hypothetical protein ESX12_05840 [Polaribacter glomeratus]